MRSLDGTQTDAIISDQKRRSFCRHAVSNVARRNQPERRHPGLVRIKRPKLSLDSEEESEQIHRFQWSLASCGEIGFGKMQRAHFGFTRTRNHGTPSPRCGTKVRHDWVKNEPARPRIGLGSSMQSQ